ncbi:Phage integrase family site specific recombinase, partial [Pseudomonas amygdali pv. lachrymans]
MTKVVSGDHRRLSAVEFQQLARVPSAVEWFANLDNPRTRRAYQNDLTDFSSFVGLASADDFRQVTRSHVLAWRADLEQRGLAGATIRRKLAALASLFSHLLENNAVAGGNPVHGVKRPRIESNEGRTPALGDHQAKQLLDAPDTETLKGLRDRAILALLLYHGLRREEAAQLKTVDLQDRRGIKHLRVHGKGSKIRFLPLHPVAAERIYAYLERDVGRDAAPGPLFRSMRGITTGAGVTANGLYTIVAQWARVAGIEVERLGV